MKPGNYTQDHQYQPTRAELRGDESALAMMYPASGPGNPGFANRRICQLTNSPEERCDVFVPCRNPSLQGLPSAERLCL